MAFEPGERTGLELRRPTKPTCQRSLHSFLYGQGFDERDGLGARMKTMVTEPYVHLCNSRISLFILCSISDSSSKCYSPVLV